VNIQFEWQVGSKDEDVETLASMGSRRPRRPWPWWAWTVLAIAAISAIAGGYLFVRQRYDQAQERIKFQIQGVIDLEARAYGAGDRDLFLSQQDDQAREWYRAQARRIRQDCLSSGGGKTAVFGAVRYGIPEHLCRPVLPATIDKVELRDDTAWVEVIEGNPPVRRTRFYRQTDLGWKHTAPRQEFWGLAIQLQYGDLVFRYHRRDQPHADPLIEHIATTFADVCSTIECPAEQLPEINFVVADAMPEPPHVQHGALLIASPWLSGLPADAAWDEAYLGELAYAVTHEMVYRYYRSLTGRGLNRLQAAVADEYAAWQATGDTTQAPILGRIVDKYGQEALPEVLRSLGNGETLNPLIRTWLGVSATRQPVPYFETLLNIERDALQAGRRDTFLLLQDDTKGWWVLEQEGMFILARAGAQPLPPAKVQMVGILDDLARVTLEKRTDVPAGQSLDAEHQTVFFRRRDGDWKHTAPLERQVDETEVASTPSATVVTTHIITVDGRIAGFHALTSGAYPPLATPTPDQRP
jgi:hypothetical protein